MLDLVEGGSSFEEVVQLAQAIEAAGATIINAGIGCNRACLDHTFGGKITSCLVNPRACRETELNHLPSLRQSAWPSSARARQA